MSRVDYDIIIDRLEQACKKYYICEDGDLYIKNGIKYLIHDIMMEYDKEFMNKLYKELEYSE